MDSKLTNTLSLLLEIVVLQIRICCTIFESVFRLIVPVKEKSVSGEIAVITGTGHGMGRELALQYAELGVTVICVDINEENNNETVRLINSFGSGKAFSFRCDVSNEEEVKLMAEKIKREFGFVSILVNNAGIMPCHRFFTYTPSEIKHLFGVNVFAHIWLMQVFLPEMIQKNQGHIITLSSMAGVIGIENLAPYCATKFAVRGMIEALHEEIRTRTNGTDVKFTIIYPYMVDTGLCQKPIIRFPAILSMVPPKEAARQIIQAARRNFLEYSIPSTLLGINHFFRLFPHKAAILVKDFLGSTLDEHDQ
jgi:all-trans-retinol dehydrogenase (NAD+)